MEKKEVKISLGTFIIGIIAIILVVVIVIMGMHIANQNKTIEESKIAMENKEKELQQKQKNNELDSSYNQNNQIVYNKLSNFDLSFLKMENGKENKIYSPLSIKYALKMLEEGADGDSRKQISKVMGNYDLTKYSSNEHMSLANSMFIRNNYKNEVKQSYINTIQNKYNSEVNFDEFNTAENINSWIRNKTLNIIPQIVQDEDVKRLDFALVNALAIDMEWKEKFNLIEAPDIIEYLHEKRIFYAVRRWNRCLLSV